MKFLNVFIRQAIGDQAVNRMFSLLEQTLKNLAKLLGGNIGSDNISSDYKSVHLGDMPSSLAGQAGKGIKVKGDETGYEHIELVSSHNLLSATHPDTTTDSPVLGDIVIGGATPKWKRKAGNTTTTRKFLRQVGTGSASAEPDWDTLQAGDIPAQEAWIALTLINGWVNYESGTSPAEYFKDSLGIIHLRGFIKNGTIGLSIGCLPAGYRPPYQTNFAVISNNAVGRCGVLLDGNIMAYVGSNVFFSLDGITFKAEY